MSELPVNWCNITLSEIGNWGSGGTPKRTNKSYYGGEIPWLVIGDLNDAVVTKSKNTITKLGLDNSSAKLLKEGVLLIAMYGSIGKLGITGFECATNQAMASCDVNEDVVSKKYLFFMLLSRRESLLSLGKGGAQQNISQTVLKAYNIPIAPLNEQTRIANKLDSLLAKVEVTQTHLEKIPTILKRFRQSVLSAATSGGLTKEWRKNNNSEYACDLLEEYRKQRKIRWEEEQLKLFDEKNKAPKNNKWKENYKSIDASELPALPDVWEWCSIDELAVTISDGDHNPPKKIENGIRHLTIRNINNGKISFVGCAYVSEEGYAKTRERYKAEDGDILITCIGTIGRTAIVGKDVFFSTDRNLAYVRLLNSINNKYIQFVLDSPFLQINMNKGSVGNAQSALYLKVIRKLPIPFCSLDEQKEIVRRVKSLFVLADTVEKQYNEAKKHTDKLIQSILAKSFKGELVPQDPNDEPAEKLLERIKELREHALQTTQKKKRANTKPTKKKVTIMRLDDAPTDYLTSLIKRQKYKVHADQLWRLSEMSIDDFYEKLRQEEEANLLTESVDEPKDRMSENRYLTVC